MAVEGRKREGRSEGGRPTACPQARREEADVAVAPTHDPKRTVAFSASRVLGSRSQRPLPGRALSQRASSSAVASRRSGRIAGVSRPRR